MKEKLHQTWQSLRHFKLSLWRIYALRIVYCLFRYFRPVRVPEGFTITTPNELISYWYFFVQHEFDNAKWMVPFGNAKSPLCLDIGANYGVFSRYLTHLNPSARIKAFEPMVDAYVVLEHNVPNVKPFMVALGSGPGYVNFEMSTGNFKQLSHSGKTGNTCAMSYLDAYNLRPLLAKIDVEGMELDVVRGGLKTLRQTPFILIESSEEHLDELDRLLPDHRCQRLTIVDWLYYLDDFPMEAKSK